MGTKISQNFAQSNSNTVGSSVCIVTHTHIHHSRAWLASQGRGGREVNDSTPASLHPTNILVGPLGVGWVGGWGSAIREERGEPCSFVVMNAEG